MVSGVCQASRRRAPKPCFLVRAAFHRHAPRSLAPLLCGRVHPSAQQAMESRRLRAAVPRALPGDGVSGCLCPVVQFASRSVSVGGLATSHLTIAACPHFTTPSCRCSGLRHPASTCSTERTRGKCLSHAIDSVSGCPSPMFHLISGATSTGLSSGGTRELATYAAPTSFRRGGNC